MVWQDEDTKANLHSQRRYFGILEKNIHLVFKIKKWFLNALKLKFDLILICENFFVSINTIFWSNLGLPFSIPWKHLYLMLLVLLRHSKYYLICKIRLICGSKYIIFHLMIKDKRKNKLQEKLIRTVFIFSGITTLCYYYMMMWAVNYFFSKTTAVFNHYMYKIKIWIPYIFHFQCICYRLMSFIV